mmetsp:Transcript_21375/g.50885  ORF Transcript_21375/g.50885 Transcript_21375/m.50885 type:complete len:201 (+) Transcript_21375:73-675(+)
MRAGPCLIGPVLYFREALSGTCAEASPCARKKKNNDDDDDDPKGPPRGTFFADETSEALAIAYGRRPSKERSSGGAGVTALRPVATTTTTRFYRNDQRSVHPPHPRFNLGLLRSAIRFLKEGITDDSAFAVVVVVGRQSWRRGFMMIAAASDVRRPPALPYAQTTFAEVCRWGTPERGELRRYLLQKSVAGHTRLAGGPR